MVESLIHSSFQGGFVDLFICFGILGGRGRDLPGAYRCFRSYISLRSSSINWQDFSAAMSDLQGSGRLYRTLDVKVREGKLHT